MILDLPEPVLIEKWCELCGCAVFLATVHQLFHTALNQAVGGQVSAASSQAVQIVQTARKMCTCAYTEDETQDERKRAQDPECPTHRRSDGATRITGTMG